jgi:hypothetical protein
MFSMYVSLESPCKMPHFDTFKVHGNTIWAKWLRRLLLNSCILAEVLQYIAARGGTSKAYLLKRRKL